jgi:hypothetical protein
MVELWNDYTQIYHRASNDADANKVWNQELLPVWGFNQSNGFKIDDLKGIFIVSSKDQNEKWVISEQEFIERYGKMIGFPSEEITSKWIAKYPVSPPTVREFQFIIQDAVENRPAQPDQITDYVVDILYNNQKSDAWKNLRKALNIDRLSSIGDPKAEFFYQSAYFVHTHEEKGTYDKKRLVLAFRELLEKVFSKEIKDTGNFKKAFEQCANNEFFGIEKDFIVSKNFILKNLSKKASSSKLPVEYVYHRFQNYGEFREFISFHNQQYPEPIFQIRTFEDYVRLHSQFLYPSLEQVSVSMRVPVSLMDLTYMFGPQELVINKKRYRSSGIMFRPESHQEMRSYIRSHNSIHHLKPDLQVHTVVDWDRLSTQFGWENSRTIRGRLLFTDFDYYTGRSVKIREDSRNYRSRQSVKFTPTSHDQVRDFLLVHNLLYRNRPDLQIRHSGDWNRLATQFNLSFAQTIRRTLGSMDFEYYLGQAEEVKDKRIHRTKGSLVFVPSSHEELRFHLSIHNNNPEIPDSDRVFSSKDWDRIAAKYGWEFTVNIAKRLGSLDFEYYTGKSENFKLRKIMNVADLVSKVEKQIQEQPYSQSEIDAFLEEIKQNSKKNKVWVEMLAIMGCAKKEALGDPRINHFLQWSLFVHYHEKFQSREKYELVAAFRHVLLSKMFQGLSKNPEFRNLFSQAVSAEIGIFGKQNVEPSGLNSQESGEVKNSLVSGFTRFFGNAYSGVKNYFAQKAFERVWGVKQGSFLPHVSKFFEEKPKSKILEFFTFKKTNNSWPTPPSVYSVQPEVFSISTNNENGRQGSPGSSQLLSILDKMYIWNNQTHENFLEIVANQAEIQSPLEIEIKKIFPELNDFQRKVLLDKYVKSDYFILQELEIKSSIQRLYFDVYGSSKEYSSLDPASIHPRAAYLAKKINQKYDLYRAYIRSNDQKNRSGDVYSSILPISPKWITKAWDFLVKKLGLQSPKPNDAPVVEEVKVVSLEDKPAEVIRELVEVVVEKPEVVETKVEIQEIRYTLPKTGLHDLSKINTSRAELKNESLGKIVSLMTIGLDELTKEEKEFLQKYIKDSKLFDPNGNPNRTEKNSYLHYACSKGFHPMIIQMLVNHGFSMNEANKGGQTSTGLWLEQFKNIRKDPQRGEYLVKVLRYLESHRLIDPTVKHIPTAKSYQETVATFMPDPETKRTTLRLLGFQLEVDHLTKVIQESIQNNQPMDYEKVRELVQKGASIFEPYVNQEGVETNESKLTKILDNFETFYYRSKETDSHKDVLADIILTGFKNQPHPESSTERLDELKMIRTLGIGYHRHAMVPDVNGIQKHEFSKKAEIYHHYISNYPRALEKKIFLDGFVYLARQMKPAQLQACLDVIFKLKSSSQEKIFNYFSNQKGSSLNTYNRTLVNQAVYIGVDVSYLKKMKEAGADFNIQNGKFLGSDNVTGEIKEARPVNHHIDVVIFNVHRTENKNNARETLRFLINEVGLTPHHQMNGRYIDQFTVAMREFGFELDEILRIAEHFHEKQFSQASNFSDKHETLVSSVKRAYMHLELKPQSSILVSSVNRSEARHRLENESSKISNVELIEFIKEIEGDEKKKLVWEALLKHLGITRHESFSEINDPRIKKFYQWGQYVHTHETINTSPKKALVIEFWREILKDFNSNIRDLKGLHETFVQATSPEVLIFGEKHLLATEDIAKVIIPVKLAQNRTGIIQNHQRWNLLFPARKIDTKRMWNKYRKEAGLPDFVESEKILKESGGTIYALGIEPQRKMTQSKIQINSEFELRILILKHNEIEQNEKISGQSSYEKLSGKYGYPSYGKLVKVLKEIDWAYVTGRTDTRSLTVKARPSKITINTLADLRVLVMKHNQEYPHDQITSDETYRRFREKNKIYMSFNALLKKVGSNIDWAYVTGATDTPKTVESNRKSYTQIAIRSETALRALVLAHNEAHPDNKIIDQDTYEKQSIEYKYPSWRSISSYLPVQVDWKYVTGLTKISQSISKIQRTIYPGIKTEKLLRELILKHNASAPIEHQITSRKTYIAVQKLYLLPSIHSIHWYMGTVSWDYVTGKIDEPAQNVANNRAYKRKSSNNAYSTVLPISPAWFMEGGFIYEWVYRWRLSMNDFGASLNRWVERISLPDFSKATALLKSFADEVRGVSGEVRPGNVGSVQAGLISEPVPEPQDQKPENDKNITEYRVKHRGRTWSLEEIKAEVDFRNSQLPEAEKIQGMRELDRVSADWNIPNREKINGLLKKNNKDRHWFFDTNFDALKKELAIHHSKLPLDSPDRISSMSTSWDEKAKKTGMKFTFSHARQILKREGKTVKELFERTKTFSDLRTSWIAYNKNHPNHQIRSAEAWEERDGKIKTLVTSEVADDILQKEGASWSELLKITSVEDLKLWVKHYRKTNPDKPFSTSRHWDETSKLSVSRQSAKNMLEAAGKDWKWLFDRKVNFEELQRKRIAHNSKYPNDRSKRIETFSRDWDRNHKKAGLPPSRTVRGWLKNSQLQNSWFFQPVSTQVEASSSKATPANTTEAIPLDSKTGSSGNIYSTVVPGLPQIVNWAINGGPQRVVHSIASTVSSAFNRPAATPEQKQVKADAKVELYQIVTDLKAIQNPFEQATALKEKETRISELTRELSSRSFESQKEMMRFLSKTVSEVKVLPVASHMPKEFGKFFAALQLAHIFKMAKDNKITTQMFGEILRELPMETVRFGTFSAGASIATGIFYDIPEMLTLKIMQQHGYQALQEIKAMKMSRGLAGTLRTEAGMRAFARGQVGMLAGTVVNLLIYNPELPWDQVWKQALQTQVSFVIAGAAVRGIAVRGTVWAGAKILRSGFMALKGAYQGSKAFSGPVGIVIMAAEFALADPIGNFITKVDKNSEAAAAVYENMIRLEYWLQNKTVPTMRFSDPCIQEPIGPTRGACYAQAALSALQMYNISMVYWPVQAVTQQFTEKQAKLDHRSVMSQLIEENEAERKEHGWGTPMIYSMAGMQSYRDDLAKLWSEYNAEANTEYYLIRQQLNSNYVDVFQKLNSIKEDCESENLISCGNELLNATSEKTRLHQDLLSRVDIAEQNKYFEDWKAARLNKDWGIGLSFLDADEWSRWVIYMAKRVGSIEVKDIDSSMVQQTFIHQALEQVKMETLFGTPDTIRRKDHNEKRNEEGYWTYAYSPDYRGFGLWGNIFAEKWHPQKTAIGNSHEDLVKNVAWMNRNKQIAQGYSLDLFTKNTLSLILPRGLKRFEAREQDLLMDLSYFYKCNWKRQNTLLSEFLVDSRSFERAEVYQSQKNKIRNLEKERSKNATYRIPSDDELDQYFAERDASVANEQPLMFIQVYSQDEQTYRFGQEPMLVFKHATGVMKSDLETYASQMTCH